MKYFTFLTLLPCILSAEVQNAICEDGTQCAQGKYCCESGCCDISKEMQDEGYVPALPPASTFNETVLMDQSETMNSFCPGTQCGQYCHPNVYDATCCNNSIYSCPPNTKCCNSSSEQPWCCKISQCCSTIRYLCINSEVVCDGTQCGSYCHHDIYGVNCCNNPKFACPYNMKCCGNSYSGYSWCCHQSHQCSSVSNLCLSGAATTSIAMMSVLIAVMTGVSWKYFL